MPYILQWLMNGRGSCGRQYLTQPVQAKYGLKQLNNFIVKSKVWCILEEI